MVVLARGVFAAHVAHDGGRLDWHSIQPLTILALLVHQLCQPGGLQDVGEQRELCLLELVGVLQIAMAHLG